MKYLINETSNKKFQHNVGETCIMTMDGRTLMGVKKNKEVFNIFNVRKIIKNGPIVTVHTHKNYYNFIING